MQLSDVRTALNEVLGKPYLAEQLYVKFNEVLGTCSDAVSPYGYLMYVRSKYGEKAAFPNLILSSSLIHEFFEYSKNVCNMLPQHVLSTCDRLTKMIELFGLDDLDIIMDRLEDSADSAIVFVALSIHAKQLNSDIVRRALENLKPSAAEYFKRYPEGLSALPSEIVNLTREQLE